VARRKWGPGRNWPKRAKDQVRGSSASSSASGASGSTGRGGSRVPVKSTGETARDAAARRRYARLSFLSVEAFPLVRPSRN
jgi:hypothetical protein